MKLEDLLLKVQNSKQGVGKARRIRLLKTEINKVKKSLITDSSQSDDANESKSSSQHSSMFTVVVFSVTLINYL